MDSKNKKNLGNPSVNTNTKYVAIRPKPTVLEQNFSLLPISPTEITLKPASNLKK